MRGSPRPHDDLPGRFLAAASALTPARRRDWGRAALAIHSEVPQAGVVALIALPGLPALLTWVALAWPRPSSLPSPAGYAVQIIAAAAIIALPGARRPDADALSRQLRATQPWPHRSRPARWLA
jgi:hypothetical protein